VRRGHKFKKIELEGCLGKIPPYVILNERSNVKNPANGFLDARDFGKTARHDLDVGPNSLKLNEPPQDSSTYGLRMTDIRITIRYI
jgi:hypothetical protein